MALHAGRCRYPGEADVLARRRGGLETIDGRQLVRVDFVAAASIREPDVDSSKATTLFAELLPSVPIISAISSINRLSAKRP